MCRNACVFVVLFLACVMCVACGATTHHLHLDKTFDPSSAVRDWCVDAESVSQQEARTIAISHGATAQAIVFVGLVERDPHSFALQPLDLHDRIPTDAEWMIVEVRDLFRWEYRVTFVDRWSEEANAVSIEIEQTPMLAPATLRTISVLGLNTDLIWGGRAQYLYEQGGSGGAPVVPAASPNTVAAGK